MTGRTPIIVNRVGLFFESFLHCNRLHFILISVPLGSVTYAIAAILRWGTNGAYFPIQNETNSQFQNETNSQFQNLTLGYPASHE